jgi:arylformamidase
MQLIMKTWQEYPTEELDRQYDNRAAVPNHPEIFHRWAESSKLIRERSRAVLDLPYGPHPRQTLDLFIPEDLSEPPPLQVFFHGGYWQAMSKDSSGFVAEGLLAAGLAVAVVGYRLCPEVGVGEIVKDARSSLAWLYQNGPAHGVDARKIQVSGHSAGGHLVAMLWLTDWPKVAPGTPPDLLHSGISVSGLFQLEPLLNTPINHALGLDLAEARALSPALAEPVSHAPLLIAVGEKESAEYHRQSRLLYENWNGSGVPVETMISKGHNHFSIMGELAGGELSRWAAKELKAHS